MKKNTKSSSVEYGVQRVALALRVTSELKRLGVPHFLDTGTLLGAVRNGRLIPHDDDFDFGVVLPSIEALEDVRQRLNLGPGTDTRFVNTYATKIECFLPAFGKYVLSGDVYAGADFHHVTVDLQLYLGRRTLHDANREKDIDPAWLLPNKTVMLEGKEWPAPRDSLALLGAIYGSIDPMAVYDEKTRLYVLPDKKGIGAPRFELGTAAHKTTVLCHTKLRSHLREN